MKLIIVKPYVKTMTVKKESIVHYINNCVSLCVFLCNKCVGVGSVNCWVYAVSGVFVERVFVWGCVM